MARGRNGAPKKPGTSSSVSEGRVWEAPSQKEKTGFNGRHFLSGHGFTGASPPCPRFERNRALVLTPTKNIRPRAMGHPALWSLASPPSLLARACFLFMFRRPRAFIQCPSQKAAAPAQSKKQGLKRGPVVWVKNCGTAVAFAGFFISAVLFISADFTPALIFLCLPAMPCKSLHF